MDRSEHTPSHGADSEFEFALGDELRGERATLGKTLLDVQRDLRIKAAYIAAIEETDPSAFPNPSFLPGYIRSYARYLSLDPDQVYRRFCAESGFEPKARRISATKPAKGRAAVIGAENFQPNFPLADAGGRGMPMIPISAIGSLAVLVALVAGLGYGGWALLQNIQRVQFAPVEELPNAIAEMETLEVPDDVALHEPELTELAKPVAATALADLYRQQELVVPILMPRDGPIAAIDPDVAGPLAMRPSPHPPSAPPAGAGPQADGAGDAEVFGPHPASQPAAMAAAAAAASIQAQPLVVVAERAAWIRVYLENGTVIFERILEKGESYSPPEGVGGPMIWAGNSGSVYVRVGEDLRGPLGSGTRAVRDVVLEPAAIIEKYALVENVPEVISQAIGLTPAPAAEPVALQ